jgi:hypothetical protein
MKNWLNSQFCFELYDTPIVIEPGVGALEINVRPKGAVQIVVAF